jgi:hypothetical protein
MAKSTLLLLTTSAESREQGAGLTFTKHSKEAFSSFLPRLQLSKMVLSSGDEANCQVLATIFVPVAAG